MDIANPKLDSPELLYPNRKPVGSVKIDYTHPMAQGLRNILALTPSMGIISSAADYLQGNLVFTGDATFYDVMEDTQWLQKATDYTICIGLNTVDISGTGVIFSRFAGTPWMDNKNLAIFTDDLAFGNKATSCYCFNAYNRGGGRVETATDTLKYGVQQDIVCYVSGINSGIYLDGELVGTKANTSTTPPQATTARVGRPAHTLLGPVKATIYYIYIYDRLLSSTEVLAIKANPYQFLIPA